MTEADNTIYVVDDDESVRRSLTRLLRSAGLSVQTFPSAESFRETVPSPDHGCLLLDVHLPGMSGIELRDILLGIRCPLPVIFITAHDDDYTRSLITDRSDTAILHKPFDTAHLLRLIQEALQR